MSAPIEGAGNLCRVRVCVDDKSAGDKVDCHMDGPRDDGWTRACCQRARSCIITTSTARSTTSTSTSIIVDVQFHGGCRRGYQRGAPRRWWAALRPGGGGQHREGVHGRRRSRAACCVECALRSQGHAPACPSRTCRDTVTVHSRRSLSCDRSHRRYNFHTVSHCMFRQATKGTTRGPNALRMLGTPTACWWREPVLSLSSFGLR